MCPGPFQGHRDLFCLLSFVLIPLLCVGIKSGQLCVLFLNPLTPRVKPWVIQSFLTFDSMDRTRSVTIHWKAVEQYFTVSLFAKPLTPRVKPWVIQSFLTFDSMDRTLKCDHSLESC